MGLALFGKKKEKRTFSMGGGGASIGVAGALSRIGTTTQSLQICKYLSRAGYKVAYIEMCRHDFVEECLETFEKTPKSVGRGYTVNGFDLFKGIADVDISNYDYLVKDYGSVSEKDFNKMSFLEQSIKVMCLGVKPGEMKYTDEVLLKDEYLSSKFIFTFIPEKEQDGLREDMQEKEDSTFFAAYTPDWFDYFEGSDRLYENILGIQYKEKESE